MPTPKPDEDKDEFMSRCIPMLIDEGKEQDEAIAICSSLWEQGSKNMSDEHIVESMDYAEWREKAKDGGAPATDILLRKNLPIEIKEVQGEDGARMAMFVLSTGDVDRYKDVIQADGWETANFMRNPVVLWSHNQSGFSGAAAFPHGGLPIARGKDLRVEGDKLVGTAEFFKQEGEDVSEAAKFIDTIWQMVKGGFLNAVSVGFDPKEWTWDEERGGYNFIRQELLEFSMVPVPANADALAIARSAAKLKGVTFDLKPMVDWSRSFLRAIDEQEDEPKQLDPEVLLEELDSERASVNELQVMYKEATEKIERLEEELGGAMAALDADLEETLNTEEKDASMFDEEDEDEPKEQESLEMDTDGEVTVLTIEEDSPEDDAALALAFDPEELRDVIAKPVNDLKRQFTKTTGIVV
jgi:hypothetical protein